MRKKNSHKCIKVIITKINATCDIELNLEENDTERERERLRGKGYGENVQHPESLDYITYHEFSANHS